MKRKKLTPREARTFKQICDLPSSSVDTPSHWILLGSRGITICEQRLGGAGQRQVILPRRTFEKFIDWYNTGKTSARKGEVKR